MSSSDTTAELYRRLSNRLSETVASVTPDGWQSPSPCPDWTVRDVLDHVIGLHEALLTMAGQDVPAMGDEPAERWETVSTAAQTALDDPEVANRTFDSQFAGVTSLSRIFDTFGAVDLVVHRWDIAHGAGVDDTMADDDLALVWNFVKDKGDMMRTPGGFGPELDAGDDPTEQERVLAFLGRAASR